MTTTTASNYHQLFRSKGAMTSTTTSASSSSHVGSSSNHHYPIVHSLSTATTKPHNTIVGSSSCSNHTSATKRSRVLKVVGAELPPPTPLTKSTLTPPPPPSTTTTTTATTFTTTSRFLVMPPSLSTDLPSPRHTTTTLPPPRPLPSLTSLSTVTAALSSSGSSSLSVPTIPKYSLAPPSTRQGSSSSSSSTSALTHPLVTSTLPSTRSVRVVYRTWDDKSLDALLWELPNEEKGHGLLGHQLISDEEKVIASHNGVDTLFGEILSLGLAKLLSPTLGLDQFMSRRSEALLDFGSGLGKLAIRAFVLHPHLKFVYGVEYVPKRFWSSLNAGYRLVSHDPRRFVMTKSSSTFFEIVDRTSQDSVKQVVMEPADPRDPRDALDLTIPDSSSSSSSTYLEHQLLTCSLTSTNPSSLRTLQMENGSMFSCPGSVLAKADLIVCNIALGCVPLKQVVDFFVQVPTGCRVLTYNDLAEFFGKARAPSFPFVPFVTGAKMAIQTSWASTLGYTKLTPPIATHPRRDKIPSR